MMKNNDPWEPWNDVRFKNDPFAPHNDTLRKDNPFEPWNSHIGRKEDLPQKDQDYYNR